MFWTVSQIALGGALGAVARYLTGVAVLRAFGATGFPLGVLGVNILGSVLMGVMVVLMAQRGLAHLGPFVMTGLLGGFTTFSAFSLETVTLIERGQTGQAALYVGLSVLGAVGGLALGMGATRAVLT